MGSKVSYILLGKVLTSHWEYAIISSLRGSDTMEYTLEQLQLAYENPELALAEPTTIN